LPPDLTFQRYNVWQNAAVAADSQDNERLSGRQHHFRTILLDRSYSCSW